MFEMTQTNQHMEFLCNDDEQFSSWKCWLCNDITFFSIDPSLLAYCYVVGNLAYIELTTVCTNQDLCRIQGSWARPAYGSMDRCCDYVLRYGE